MDSAICHVDIESFSRINLKQCGLYRYAQDDSTELLCVCFAFGDEAVSTWVPVDGLPTELIEWMHAHHEIEGGEFIPGTQVPFELESHAAEGGELRAHNSEFERTMLNGVPGQKVGFPETTIEQWVCTAAKAAVHGLPRALGKVAAAVQSPHLKNEDGRMMMMQVIKTRKPSKEFPEDRWTPWNSPDRFFEMYLYCIDDVEAERAIDEIIPDLSPHERQVYMMDQRINKRGIRVDLEGTANVKFLRDAYKKVLREKCAEISGFNPSQTGKLGEWIRERYNMPNLQEVTMKKALADPDIPADVKAVVRCRRLHELKAVAKLDAIQRQVCADERLYGQFLYYGAGTGRWSSLGVQLQNLMRPLISDAYVALEACEARDIQWIHTLYEKNPMHVLSSTIRSLLIAGPGHELLCLDYSSIEGRITAWLAGQEDKLEIFRTHGKVYEYTGAKMNRLPLDLEFLMTMKQTHPDERFTGKTGELACGYQGGYKAFTKMAAKFGIDIDKERAMVIVSEWREANDKIVELWYRLEEYAIAAVAHPGKVFKTNRIKFGTAGDWLYMKLPSGRRIAYYKPEINIEGQLTYLGIDTYTRQWCRVNTYGGRLCENAASGTARDVMVFGCEQVEDRGYPILGTVHDEIIMEPQMNFGSVEEAAHLMCNNLPACYEGLPVSADGFRHKRYRKDD